MNNEYVIGVDFGTDSVRSVIINSHDGSEVAQSVHYYKRWSQGLYCQPLLNQFRQHPQDYIEGLQSTITEALSHCPPETGTKIKGLAVDTTGSTPVALNEKGTPLALTPGFEENPNAMFVLWKDHTAVKEAEEINQLARSWGGIDYTKYEGGIYSSEWFWAKILHILREDQAVAQAAYSWAEHCDWIPYLLCGLKDLTMMKRSRCAAGHKAMWHGDFNGLPNETFLQKLDPLLAGLRDRLYTETYTSNEPAGQLCGEWAEKLGLSTEVVVSVGAFDAHMGAVGGEIEPYYLSKVMGTSTCDMLVAPNQEVGDKLVSGICGQVDGSVIPGMLGMEAGQSAFGDVYAWFKDLLAWPLKEVLEHTGLIDQQTKEKLLQETLDQMIPKLSEAAAKISVGETEIIALDWLNGRRTPDADQSLKGAIAGLSLGSGAPRVFKALVEATCFGARQIVDRFIEEGIRIDGIIGLGGVAKKSPYIMQTMANVLNRPIKIAKSEQSCALGAAMFAATAAGIYPNVIAAKKRMGAGFETTYHPVSENVIIYERLYRKYQSLGSFVEQETKQLTAQAS